MEESMVEFKRGQSDKEFEKLSKKDKSIMNEFKDFYGIDAGKERTKDAFRNVLRFLVMINKPIDKITLKDLRLFLKILKDSNFADYTKNNIKAFVQRFLRWKFKDWSVKFDEFRDIKFNSDAQRKDEITSEETFSEEEITKCVKSENKTYWKAFFLAQYEGALRTKEVRSLRWDELESDGEYLYGEITSKKNKNAAPKKRPIILKTAKYYIEKLREEQENTNRKGIYIFNALGDINKPINKASVSDWMRDLTIRALGKRKNSYMLRHTRASEYKKLVKEKKMSKDNAVETMGHSEKMFDKVYSHLDKKEIKDLLKTQIYDFEDMPEETKHHLEIQIEQQAQAMKEMEEKMNNMLEFTMKKMGFNPEWAELQEKKLNKKMDGLKSN